MKKIIDKIDSTITNKQNHLSVGDKQINKLPPSQLIQNWH